MIMKHHLLIIAVIGAMAGATGGAVGPDQAPRQLRQLVTETAVLQPLPLPQLHPSSVLAIWKINSAEQPTAYALQLRGHSRSANFTLWLVLDHQATIVQVVISQYMGNKGGGVRRKSFLQQFVNKNNQSPPRLNAGIDAVSGATLSSKAVTKLIADVLQWWTTVQTAAPNQ